MATYLVLWLVSWKAAQAGEIVDFVSAWYLPAGITFAFTLLFGPRFLPVVLALEVSVGFVVHREAPAIWTFVPMIVVAGYGLAAMAVHWGRAGPQLTSLRDVCWIVGAGAAGAALVALLGSIAYVESGIVGQDEYALTAATWWTGDFLGVLIATPVLLQIGNVLLRGRTLRAGSVQPDGGVRSQTRFRTRLGFPSRRAMPLWLGYAVALAVPPIFVLLRIPLEPFLGTAPFLLLFPAVSIAAFIGGLGPGLVSVGACSGIALMVYLAPQGGPGISQQTAALLLLFVLVAALQVFILDQLRTALRRTERARARELLLRKEIQHRAANIMQIAIGIARLQARSETAPGRQALQNVLQRLQTLADTQRSLMGESGSANVGMLGSIAKDVLQGIADDRISCVTRIDAAMSLGPEQIQSLGLIIGELITNSVKHAFAAEERGRIEISLSPVGADILELDYTDSGKPFPSIDRASGSGMQLIGALAAQLGGNVSWTNHPHKRVTIRFPVR